MDSKICVNVHVIWRVKAPVEKVPAAFDVKVAQRHPSYSGSTLIGAHVPEDFCLFNHGAMHFRSINNGWRVGSPVQVAERLVDVHVY